MNERIEKLIDDAKLTAVSEMFEDNLAKFAELIVRECADVAFLEANSRKTQRAVLQHFGIE
jgi:hypothetical protein